LLFKDNIEISDLTDQDSISMIKKPTSILTKNGEDGLYFNSNGIWVKDNLVARYSTPLAKVIWYPDKKHLVFQQNDEIRILELNGK
jgi:hypothetical protein